MIPLRLLRSLLFGFVLAGALNGFFPCTCSGQTAFDLLSGFDAQRLAKTFPVENSASAGEMAKLLYRLRKADSDALASRRKPNASGLAPGEVTSVSGQVNAVRKFLVPEALTEFLELESFYEVTLTDEAGGTSVVFTPPLAGRIGEGDRIVGDAVFLASDGLASDGLASEGLASEGANYFAAGKLAWMPAQSDRPGWRLLADEGIDLGLIAQMQQRNRRTLQADDADAFYTVLAASKKLSRRPVETLPPPQRVAPVDLLKTPTQYQGNWIRLPAVTVRVTRVAIDQPALRNLLGQDHYFQIDASGDLGNTIVQLQRADGDSGDPILMSGAYPVSLVATDLPEFLSTQMDDQQTVVAMISVPIAVEGFFLRLWSYENEFMTREGGGKQVGPLIVVSKWYSRQSVTEDDGGVELLGYALAAAIIAAIGGTIWWTRKNAREDARARQRSSTIPDSIEVPPS